MCRRTTRSRLGGTLTPAGLAGALLIFACSSSDLEFTADTGGAAGIAATAGNAGVAQSGAAGRDGSGGASTAGSGANTGAGNGGHGAGSNAGRGGNGGDGGGAGGTGATGGSGAGGAGGDETGGIGGGAGEGGSAGEGGTSGGDAGSGAGGACDARAWFPDADGDEVGRTSGKVTACSGPEEGVWVEQGGDCNDDNDAVSPKQKDFMEESYMTPGGTTSFDYDCSGVETSDPSQVGAAPTCPATLLGCSGWGYLGTGRSGPGVNPLCGSTSTRTCVSNGIGCMAVVGVISEPHRCR